jgi:hypothetical protein
VNPTFRRATVRDTTMLPLGFGFDVEAVVLDGTEHRADTTVQAHR